MKRSKNFKLYSVITFFLLLSIWGYKLLAVDNLSLTYTSIDDSITAWTSVSTISSTNQTWSVVYSLSCSTHWADDSAFSIWWAWDDELIIWVEPDASTKSQYDICIKATDDNWDYEQNFTLSVIDKTSPEFNSITVTSNNSKSWSFAKVWDTLTVSVNLSNNDTSWVWNSLGFDLWNETWLNLSFNQDSSYTNSKSQTYTILAWQSWSIDVKSLTFNDDSWNSINGFSLPYYITNNVIVDSDAPIISFTDDVFILPWLSDTINISVSDDYIDEDSLYYGFSSDDICDQNDNYDNKYSYWISFDITGDAHLWEYICAKAGDYAWNVTYLRSSNKLNVIVRAITLTNNTIDENSATWSLIGILWVMDDVPVWYSYTLVEWTWSDDNSLFSINSDELHIEESPNFETKSLYKIRLKATPTSWSPLEQEFYVNINDINDPLVDFVMNGWLLDENTWTWTEAWDFQVYDEDTNETYDYSFVSWVWWEDNSSFTISWSTVITNFNPDYEIHQQSYNILVWCTWTWWDYIIRGFTIDIYDNAEAPTDISITNTNIDENMWVWISVWDLTSTDDDIWETFTYSLVLWTWDNDNSLFAISWATLITNANLNYESDSSYSIRVRTTDYAWLYFEKEFTITLNNVSEAPTDITMSNSSINENVWIWFSVWNFSWIDEDVLDTFTYNLVSWNWDDDNWDFNIIWDDLVTAINPNFEIKSSYKIRVSTTDSNWQIYEKEFTITINDVNEAGEDISMTSNKLAENMSSWAIIGDFITVDQDTSDTYTYSFITWTWSDDNALFSISWETLIAEFTADYETKDNYTILVKSVDGGWFEVEKQITININDVNNAPTDVTLSWSTIFENSFIWTFLGTLIWIDDWENNWSLSYSLSCTTPWTDDSKFMIDWDELKTAWAINYETWNPFEVCIQISDWTLTFDKNINIDVTDINESPYDFKFTQNLFDENTPTWFLVWDLSSMDEDLWDTLTYSFWTWVWSTDNISFVLSWSQLFSNFAWDYETKNIYNVKFKVTDNWWISAELPTTILLNNLNELPTDVTLSKSDIDENIWTWALVWNFTTIDQDLWDNHIYTLETWVWDDDNTAFNIVWNALVTNFVWDYETKDTYNIRIRSTDWAWLYTEREFTITINDVVDYLVDFTLSWSILNENAWTLIAVWDFNSSSVNTWATYTYTLVNWTWSNDNSSFSISGATLIAEFEWDYETKDSYIVRVKSIDNLSVSTEKEFTINILNENEWATNITLSNNSIYEESTWIKFIWNLNSNDPDLNDSYNYELVTWIWSDDNDLFMIVWNSLLADFIPDYETKDTYNIRVRWTDSQWIAYEKTFVIYVNDTLENPTDITLTSNTIDEWSLSWSIIWDFGTTWTNSWATYTYTFSWTWANDNTLFVLSWTTLITDFVSNYETQNTYNVIITATDNYWYTFEKWFTIYINNLNENPSDIDLDNNTLLENTQTWTIVWYMQTTDEDNWDTYIYSLVSWTWSDDNASFSISWATLISDMIPDYETQNIYYVRIKSTDNWWLYTEKEFIINILNENNAPTDVTLSWSTIDENQVIWTYIWDVTWTDDWEDNWNLSFSMNCLMKWVDDDSFVLSGTTLYSNQVFNYEAKDSYNICIRANDWTNNFDKNFVISVNNLAENPTDITLSWSTLDENLSVWSIVWDLETIWTNTWVTYTYTLIAWTWSDNNASFSISWSTLLADFTANYETKNSYSIRVKSVDNLWSEVETMLTILISNVNELPISFDINNSSINENLPVWSTIWDFTTTDIDSWDTHTYSLVSWTWSDDNASFSISWSTLITEISADYETKNIYSVLVRSTDAGWLYTEKVFTITINDISEWSSNNTPTDITLSWSTLDESSQTGTIIWDFTTTDSDSGDTFTYSLVSWTWSDDNASFSITGSKLVAEFSADYETKSSYSIRVRTTDNWGLSTEKEFTITINNIYWNWFTLSWSVLDTVTLDENTQSGTFIGKLISLDTTDPFTFSFTSLAFVQQNNNLFTLTWDTIYTKFVPDYETKSSYYILVEWTNTLWTHLIKWFTININDINEWSSNNAPTDITLSGSTLVENSATWKTIWDFATIDLDTTDTHTYTLVHWLGDDDNTIFSISWSTLVSEFSPDYETKTSYSIRVRTTDNWWLSTEKEFTITIDDVSWYILTWNNVDENSPIWTVAATMIPNDANDPYSPYTFTSMSWLQLDNSMFTISWSTIITNFVPNFETKSTYNIMIDWVNNLWHHLSVSWTITINDVNENPTDVNIDNNSIYENMWTWTIIWALSTIDQDTGNTYTYTLVSWTWSNDNASFSINWANIIADFSADYETKTSYTVRVRSTDNWGLYTEKEFTITINDVNENPINNDNIDPVITRKEIKNINETSVDLELEFIETNILNKNWIVTVTDGLSFSWVYNLNFSWNTALKTISWLNSDTTYTYVVTLTDDYWNTTTSTWKFSTAKSISLTWWNITETWALSLGFTWNLNLWNLYNLTWSLFINSDINDSDSLTWTLSFSWVDIIVSSGSWNWILIPPTLINPSSSESATWSEIWTWIIIIETIKTWSENAWLSSTWWYFIVTFVVPWYNSWTVFNIYRSEDWNNWISNIPDNTCTLDWNSMCTFRTNHLTFFALWFDTMPDVYVFNSLANAELNRLYESNTINVSWINTWTTINIIWWEYRIWNWSYTSSDWIVNDWDYITVRQTSSSSYWTQTNLILTIWWVVSNFNITTKNSSSRSSGWWSSVVSKDKCTSWDYSPSYYDNSCWTKPKTTWTWATITNTYTSTWTIVSSTWWTIKMDSSKISQIIDDTFKVITYEPISWEKYTIQRTKSWSYIVEKSDWTYINKVFVTIDDIKNNIKGTNGTSTDVLDFDNSFKPVVYINNFDERFILRKTTDWRYVLYTENWTKLNWYFNKQYDVLKYLQKIFWKTAFTKVSTI